MLKYWGIHFPFFYLKELSIVNSTKHTIILPSVWGLGLLLGYLSHRTHPTGDGVLLIQFGSTLNACSPSFQMWAKKLLSFIVKDWIVCNLNLLSSTGEFKSEACDYLNIERDRHLSSPEKRIVGEKRRFHSGDSIIYSPCTSTHQIPA